MAISGLDDGQRVIHSPESVSITLTPERMAWGFVALGVLACSLRYALGFPLIPDEAALAMNLARLGYGGMLGELQFGQMAPPGFLLLVKACTDIFGFNEWAMRAPAFAAAVGALVLFRVLAGRVLAGWPMVIAVAVYSVSYWPLRYGAEVKPYAVDMLLSCAWLLLAHAWIEGHRPLRSMLMMMALGLVGFAVSFPSVFVGGGAVLAMLATHGLGARHRPWHGWNGRQGRLGRLVQPVVVGVCLVVGFLGTYAFLVPSRSETAQWMVDYWQKAFPPTDSLGSMFLWLIDVITGELLPYPVGGENFASTGTLLFVLLGTGWLIIRRRWGLLALLGAPIFLGLVAGFMQKYPFGQPTRLQLYLAPVFCLLAGQGLAVLLDGLQSIIRAPAWRSPRRVALAALALVAIATMARDVLVPHKSSTDLALREATSVLWGPARFGAPRPLSLREDLGATFVDEPEGMHSDATRFLANFYIRVGPRAVPSAEPIDAMRPVEVVTFLVQGGFDPSLRDAWIARFQAERGLRLAGVGRLSIPHVDNRENLLRTDTIEVLRFEPAP
ncbi:MAG: glycosyltransferase family 39 protein [Phycisphaeraceae bacterium]|nr:glycosyltransferase family 39 protein [Phycisphaeraceae bacterium]